MDDRIKEHLKNLNKYYLLLRKIQKKDYKDFKRDEILQGSSERFLQLAIESCLNIGNRLISLEQFNTPTETPETYADIFVQLKNLDVIDNSFCDRLVKMTKFRNRLVHLYWEIDPQKVYEIIVDNLEDFKHFERDVVKFLKASEQKEKSSKDAV
ncbi:MAG: DUF86 domain-containing protein [Desulfobacterales bacterium]